MSKRQTRRSISMRAEAFVRLREFCRLTDQAMSAFVEEAIAEALDRGGASEWTRTEALDALKDAH